MVIAAVVFAVSAQQPSSQPPAKAPDAKIQPASPAPVAAETTVAEKKSDSIPAKAPAAPVADSVKMFTPEELAKCNGQNGNPAYVAVDGIVYDVTNVKAWAGGKHHGVTPGADVTTIIKKKSPHGTKVLKNLKTVGKLAIPAVETKPATPAAVQTRAAPADAKTAPAPAEETKK
jgi:predicted heme/steroid binding protein